MVWRSPFVWCVPVVCVVWSLPVHGPGAPRGCLGVPGAAGVGVSGGYWPECVSGIGCEGLSCRACRRFESSCRHFRARPECVSGIGAGPLRRKACGRFEWCRVAYAMACVTRRLEGFLAGLRTAMSVCVCPGIRRMADGRRHVPFVGDMSSYVCTGMRTPGDTAARRRFPSESVQLHMPRDTGCARRPEG